MNTKNNHKKIKTFTFADIILAVAVLIASVFLMMSLFHSKSDLRVVVNKDGKEVYSINLQDVSNPFEYKIDGSISLTLLIEHDGVTVIESECKDKICQSAGKLTKSGQIAVCLPAKVTVKLDDVGDNRISIDGVAR